MKQEKIYAIAVAAFLLTACFGPQDDKQNEKTAEADVAAEKGITWADIGEPLTAEQYKAFMNMLETEERKEYPLTRDKVKFGWSDLELCTIPYLEVDLKAFRADPSPENLMNCMRPARGRYMMIGKYKGELAAMFSLYLLDGRWRSSIGMFEKSTAQRSWGWLPTYLNMADDHKFFVVEWPFCWHFVMNIKGEPAIFYGGQPFSRSLKDFAGAWAGYIEDLDRWPAAAKTDPECRERYEVWLRCMAEGEAYYQKYQKPEEEAALRREAENAGGTR